tara:strand:+ start:915 stop:1256 length:342 start_codon:yes stop_codon:yes gene_type:complete
MKIDHLEIKNFNFFGINTEGEGELSLYGKTYFYGKHIGNISQEDDNEATFDEECEINGNIFGRKIIIRGKITGSVIAKEVLTISAGATVTGDVSAKNLDIHPGAKIKGNIKSL